MSEVVGEAVLKIRTDDSAVDSGITSAGKKAGVGYSKGFSSGLKGLAGAAGLALGANELAQFLKGGISAATSLQDEMGALGVIIGEGPTKQVEAFADKSAQAFGISKVDALEAAHTFSTFGKSAGLAGDDLATFATDFTGLAGNLASFNGGSTEDAITAIGSALRGEAEPIRRYGVLLDDATLKQAAVRLGIIKTTKEALTPQQKVLAAQAEIYRQTKDAQGDFARTSDSAANSQKRLTAQLKDVQTKLGTQLLPVLTEGSQALSDFITEMQNGTGAGGEFVEVLQTTVKIGKEVFQFFDSLPGPVKKYGAELLIVAAVLSKVGGGLDVLNSKLKTTKIDTDGVATSSYALGGILRNVAGAGGLLLMQQGLKETNDQLGFLEGAAGGALTGGALGAFAGGPGIAIGAAVGGLAGGLLTLADNTDKAGEAAAQALPPTQSYTTALQAGADAVEKYNRETAQKNLQEAGALKGARLLGISTATLVNATLGSPAAIAKVSIALAKAKKQYEQTGLTVDAFGNITEGVTVANAELAGAAGDVSSALFGQTKQLQAETIQANEAALAQGRYSEVLKGIPKNVATRIDQIGLEAAEDKIFNLRRQYDLTPQKIRTILEAAGTPEKKIQAVIDKAKELDRQKPVVKVDADTRAAQLKIRRLRETLNALFGKSANIRAGGTGALLGVDSNQTGTENFAGGFTTLNEAGTERVYLPPGTRVMTAAQTRQAEAREASAAAPVVVSGGGGTLVVQQNYYGPTSTFERQRDAEWAARYHTAGAPVRMG